MTQTQTYPTLICLPTNVITLHDVVLDSPLWRANVIHVEDQIDQFAKWIDKFTSMIKQYIEAMEKQNIETRNLSKWTHTHTIDSSLLDPHIADTVLHAFVGTLQSEFAFRQKLVSDLQEILITLQQWIKKELKDFKESRKQFEKSLDRYESQLNKYNFLSKQKEPSALREDAFQTFDVRTLHTRSSGDYFVHLIRFKSMIEHQLVLCFSSALQARIDEVEEAGQACSHIRMLLPGWRLWLDENKESCALQLDKIQKSCVLLEDAYIRQTRPHRSLKRYITLTNKRRSSFMSPTPTPTPPSKTTEGDQDRFSRSSFHENRESRTSMDETLCLDNLMPKEIVPKQGYLFQRLSTGKTTRYSWMRRWFFLHDGWFGSCNVTTMNKVKGSVVIEARVRINECKGKINSDLDRRFCFEIYHNNSNFMLQAETEEEMMQWLWAVEKHKEIAPEIVSGSSSTSLPVCGPVALFAPRMDTLEKRELSVEDPKRINRMTMPIGLSAQQETLKYQLMPTLSTTYSVTSLMIRESRQTHSPSSSALATPPTPATLPSIPSTSNAPSALSVLNISSSSLAPPPSSPVMQESISTANSEITPQSSISWGMPWFMSGINALSNNASDIASLAETVVSSPQESCCIVVWPTKLESRAPKVKLSGYTQKLRTLQQELRKYFDNVAPDEVVLEGFSGSLYLPHRQIEEGHKKVSKDDKATISNQENVSNEIEVSHSGYCYLTQRNLWFYSCSMMACVNTLVIPIKDIKTLQFDRGISVTCHMVIELYSLPVRYCFGLWLESVDKMSDKIKLVVDTIKDSKQDIELQSLYDTLKSITPGRKSKTVVTQFTAISALNAAVTPLNVQAHPQTCQIPTLPGTNTVQSTLVLPQTDPASVQTSDMCVQKTSAAGALTAAMEAATATTNTNNNNNSLSSAMTASKRDKPSPLTENTFTEREAYTETLWPSTLEKPTEPVQCKCNDHLDKVEVQVEMNISAKQLFDILFSESQSGEEAGARSIWYQLSQKKTNTDFTIGTWTTGKEKKQERTLKYIMAVNNSMVKAKETDVIETHQILEEREYLSYVVLVSTKTPNLPYADSFVPCIKYCITYTTPTRCQLSYSFGVKWLKSIMLKSIINRTASKGLAETIEMMQPLVQQRLTDLAGTYTKENRVVESTVVIAPTKEEPTVTVMVDHQQTSPGFQNIISAGLYVLAAIILWLVVYHFSPVNYMDQLLATNSTVVWRGVYLRDLDKETAGHMSGPIAFNHGVYQTFQASRIEPIGWNYTWFSTRHRHMAVELIYTRERLGAMRYELLAAFRMLNSIEQHIVESEYQNWLLDGYLRCEDGVYDLEGCDGIRKELARH
ncbi:hypothetical protein BDF14DRAFT_1883469 [Spinellus fusiger]|nr:hypothetical protein BDF14DRAFT_1883469 [Spinellus fusiger]